MTTWTDELLDELAFEADPPVDQAIAEHAALHVGDGTPRDLVRSVAQHLVLPPEQRSPPLAALLDQPEPLPAWADQATLDRASKFFGDRGLEIGAGLFCASLPEAYASARGSRVLVLTAELVTEPVRRVYETAEMILHAMSHHGLEPAPADVAPRSDPDDRGAGYVDARRVRLMHGAVRYLVEHDPDIPWVDAAPVPPRGWLRPWGVPINQEDLLGTLMTFTVTIFETLALLGRPATADEQADYLHRWSVVGHLLGIRPDLLPITPASAVELTAAIRRRQQHATDDSRTLTKALVDALEGAVLWPLDGLIPATMRWFVGDPLADSLALASNGWSVLLQGLVRRLADRSHLDAGHDVVRRAVLRHWNRAVMDQFLKVNRGGDRPNFDIPRDLAPSFRPDLARQIFRLFGH